MSKSKILFIEDDDQLLKLYCGIFIDTGYGVVVAKTGVLGLTLARKEKPDLIILDIMLPGGMNGFDVLEQLKRDDDLKEIPVLVFTNLENEEKVAKEIGAEEYIVKVKVDPKDVVRRINKVLQK